MVTYESKDDDTSDLESRDTSLVCPSCDSAFEIPRCYGEEDASYSHIPQILSECFHTVCRSCIEDASQRFAQGGFPCHVCSTRQKVEKVHTNFVPIHNLREWRSRQGVIECEECNDEVPSTHSCSVCNGLRLCDDHAENHKRSTKTCHHNVMPLDSEESIENPVSIRRRVLCLAHSANASEAKLYCPQCQCLICHECSVENHVGHGFHNAQDEDDSCRKRLTAESIASRKCQQKLDLCMAAVRAVEREAQSRRGKTDEAIRACFDGIRQALDAREKALLSLSSSITDSKLAGLEAQQKRGNDMSATLGRGLQIAEAVLEDIQGDEFVAMAPMLSTRLEELRHQAAALISPPCEDPVLSFRSDEDIAQVLQQQVEKFGWLDLGSHTVSDVTGNAPPPRNEPKSVPIKNQNLRPIHFTTTLIDIGVKPTDEGGCMKMLGYAAPRDLVVIEVRDGSDIESTTKIGAGEKDGDGALLGSVSFSLRVEGPLGRGHRSELPISEAEQHVESCGVDAKTDNSVGETCVPAIRFTKVLRLSEISDDDQLYNRSRRK